MSLTISPEFQWASFDYTLINWTKKIIIFFFEWKTIKLFHKQTFINNKAIRLVSVKFHKQFTVPSLFWKFGIDLHLEYFTEMVRSLQQQQQQQQCRVFEMQS